MVRPDSDFTLYLVTDRRWLGGRTLWDCVEEAIRGGVTFVQLREKEISSRDFFDLATRVKEVTDRHRIPLVVNDRIDIAQAIDADGVHIGPDDLPVAVARRLLGERKIIGASAASLDEALGYQREGADYLGVGAVFPTATKQGTDQVRLGDLAGIKAAVRIPVVAIGGIGTANAVSVIETGVDGVAVVSAIMNQPRIGEATRHLRSLLTRAVPGDRPDGG